MSKVKTTILLVLLLALVNIATSIQLRTKDFDHLQLGKLNGQSHAASACPDRCKSQNATWNGQWTNDGRNKNSKCGCRI